MGFHVKLAELANMSTNESDRVLANLVSSAKSPRNGQKAILEARIRGYELRYEMSSAKMREGLLTGSLRETADVAKWLLTLAALETNDPRQART